MTWNIRTGVGSDPKNRETTIPADLERIATVIRRVQPDVLALQEVDRNRARTDFADQAGVLAGLLGMDGVFAPNLVDDAGEYGVATLSRSPIVASEHVRFPVVDGWEPRGMLQVDIVPGGTSVRVMNTHLQVGNDGNDEEAALQRMDAATAIALRAKGLSNAVLLMGDFNADPGSEELRSLRFLSDVWEEKNADGGGATFPASPFEESNQRIDAIFASSEWLVRDVAVLVDAETKCASDHYPLVADLVLVDAPG